MTFANSKIKTGKTTLCYGVQWDAALNFIDSNYITNEVDKKPNCEPDSYLVDSTDKGWYGNNYKQGNPDHKTGIDLTTKANSPKNIYDMAGNVREWTMESYDTNIRVIRGGNYAFSGKMNPASGRISESPSFADGTGYGFRVTLYL